MKVLLDTNALLRWMVGTIPARAAREVKRADLVLVSAVTACEISIKRAAGKLRFSEPVEEALARYGFQSLPFTMRHADRVYELPLHHHDPFDRMLIAQALEDGYTIVTSDRAFEPYRVPVIWA